MTIKLSTEYPGNIDITVDDPDGTFKNSTSPGAKDGTPYEKRWASDLWALSRRLLAEAEITPNNTPDTAEGSNNQQWDAAVKMFANAVQTAQYDYVVGKSSDFGANVIYWNNGTSQFLDKDALPVSFVAGDRILIKDMQATLTVNMDFGSADRLFINTIGGYQIPLGDSGSGIPYNIIFSGDQVRANFNTDQDFEDVALVGGSLSQQRVIKARGLAPNVRLNNRQIFGRNQISIVDFKYVDPYALYLNGQLLPNGQTEFKEIFNRIGFVYTPNLFNPTGFNLADWRGRGIRVGDDEILDPDIHIRNFSVSAVNWPGTANPITGNVNAGGTVTLDATAFGVQADNLKFLSNLRGTAITGTGIPGTPTATSLVESANIATPSAVVLTLIDPITGLPPTTTPGSGITFTFLNGYAAWGSLQDDAFQGHLRDIGTTSGADDVLVDIFFTGPNAQGTNGGYPTSVSTDPRAVTKNYLIDSPYGTPRVTSESRMKNILTFAYYLL